MEVYISGNDTRFREKFRVLSGTSDVIRAYRLRKEIEAGLVDVTEEADDIMDEVEMAHREALKSYIKNIDQLESRRPLGDIQEMVDVWYNFV